MIDEGYDGGGTLLVMIYCGENGLVERIRVGLAETWLLQGWGGECSVGVLLCMSCSKVIVVSTFSSPTC